jgi:hypothetical protein
LSIVGFDTKFFHDNGVGNNIVRIAKKDEYAPTRRYKRSST